MSVGDEQQIERMYELLDSHQKRAAAAAASTRRDTRTDTDNGRPIRDIGLGTGQSVGWPRVPWSQKYSCLLNV